MLLFNTSRKKVDQRYQVITHSVWTDWVKSCTSPSTQSFHKWCEKASSDLCSTRVNPRRQFAFTGMFFFFLPRWHRPSATLQYCSIPFPLSKMKPSIVKSDPEHLIPHTHLDVGVVLAGGAPLASTSLLFAVFIKLWVAKDGHSSALVNQGHSCNTIQPLLICSGHRQHYRHRQVDDAT